MKAEVGVSRRLGHEPGRSGGTTHFPVPTCRFHRQSLKRVPNDGVVSRYPGTDVE